MRCKLFAAVLLAALLPNLVVFAAPPAVDESQPTSMIALTFDDGPSIYTKRILETLEQYGGKATFCLVGNRIGHYKETTKAIADQGNEIIGHSWNHQQLTKLSAEKIRQQLQDTNDAIFDVTGLSPALFRPPYGSVNKTLRAVSAEMGLALLNWSVDTLDWKYRDASRLYNYILENAKDGSVVLCHDIYKTTADAMDEVIPALISKGYTLVTVSQLMQSAGKELEAGVVYNKR